MFEREMPRPDGEGPVPRFLAYVVAGTMFMAQLDSTIIATALPRMAVSFGTGATNLSLGISIYLLAQAVLLPASNWVSDRFGARRIFALAVALFTLASILCGLSGSLSQFIAARLLQGGAAALMTPVGRVVLIRSTAKRDLVQVLTMASTPMLIAPTLGPPLGGFIVSYLSWPWVFYLNVPFGIVSVALILRVVPDLRASERRPFDTTGFILVALALSGLIYGLDRITAPRNAHGIAALCVVGGLLAGVAAVRHARRAAHPLLSLAPLRSDAFRIIAVEGGAFARLPMRALPFILPLAFQLGLGMSAFVAGVMLTGSYASDLIGKPFVRPVLRRIGFRAAILWSQIASSVAIAMLGLGLAGLPLAIIFLLLAVTGFARSLLFSSMSSLLYTDMDETATGAATVLWNVVQQATNAFAVSLTVIALNLLAWTHDDYGGRPSIGDFRIALLILAVVGLPALVSFRRLAPDAGGAMSGHVPKV